MWHNQQFSRWTSYLLNKNEIMPRTENPVNNLELVKSWILEETQHLPLTKTA